MKRKSIKKQIKSKLYVAKATDGGWSRGPKAAPRKEVVDGVKQILAKPQFKKMVKHIDRISITTGGSKGTGYKTAGEIVTKSDGRTFFKIIDYSYCDADYYKLIAVHELAHVHWGVMHKWHKEAWDKFNNIVGSLRPVNKYLQRHEALWKSDIRYQEEANQYMNEMHSAAAELYYESEQAMRGSDQYQFPEDQKILLEAYRELHGLE